MRNAIVIAAVCRAEDVFRFGRADNDNGILVETKLVQKKLTIAIPIHSNLDLDLEVIHFSNLIIGLKARRESDCRGKALCHLEKLLWQVRDYAKGMKSSESSSSSYTVRDYPFHRGNEFRE